MKIQIFSDLHLDIADYRAVIDSSVDVAIFAGDLHTKARAVDWLNRTYESCEHSPYFLYVPGNHEAYQGHIPRTYQKIESMIANNKILFLDNNCITINEVKFIGCTLWTDLNLNYSRNQDSGILRAFMNDYRQIRLNESNYRRLQPDDTCRFHDESLKFIKNELLQGEYTRAVVVTHHAPSAKSLDPNRMEKSLDPAYASNLDYLFCRASFSHPPAIWVHGHIHKSNDYLIENTRIVSNPRGYAGIEENPDFKDAFVIYV